VIAALDGGATKATVCRIFGIQRSTLIDSLARIGWSAGLDVQGSMSGLVMLAGKGRPVACYSSGRQRKAFRWRMVASTLSSCPR